MAKQLVNIGTTPNDGTGDQLRTAFDKINDNINEIYSGQAGVVRQTPPTSAMGDPGDVVGMIAFFQGKTYFCKANYDGVSSIWERYTIAPDALPW